MAAPSRRFGCLYFVKLSLVAMIGLIPIFAVLVGVKGVSDADGWIYPYRHPVDEAEGVQISENFQSVEFPTEDGLTLRGWYFPSQNGAAVMVIHHMSYSRMWMLRQAGMLVDHGYGVLMFDVRGHGNSDGEKLSHVWYDGIAAADFLKRQPDVERIGAWGLSLGGLIAIHAAAEDERIEAVMVDGPGPAWFEDMPAPETINDWMFVPYDFAFFPSLQQRSGGYTLTSTRQASAKIAPRPIFFVSMVGERTDQRAEQRMVQGFFDSAQEPKFLWQIPNTGHGAGPVDYPEEYQRRMIEFFDQHLK